MRLTIISKPQFVGKNKMLKLASGAIFSSLGELPGEVVIPISLMSTLDNKGQRREPFVITGQPTYTNSRGVRRTSIFSTHLDAVAEEAVGRLVDGEFFKKEARRLVKNPKRAEYSRTKDGWKHEGDFEFSAAADPKDEELMKLAETFANKAAAEKEKETGGDENEKNAKEALGGK